MAIYKVDARFDWSGGQVHNIFYAASDPGDGQEMADDAGQWLSAFYAPIAGYITAEMIAQECVLYEWDGTDWALRGSDTFAFTGTGSTLNTLPRQSAALCIMRTDIERCVGKKYIAGIAEAFQGSGFLDATLIAALGNANDAWRNPFTGTNGTVFNPGVFNKATSTLGNAVSTAVRRQMSTQRSRKLGNGV